MVKGACRNAVFPEIMYFKFENKVPIRFIKAGRVWCGGARETP